MGIDPTEPASVAANETGQPDRFWQKFAKALDRLAVNRSQRAIPAIALRRSKRDHDRCRRLMKTLHAHS